MAQVRPNSTVDNSGLYKTIVAALTIAVVVLVIFVGVLVSKLNSSNQPQLTTTTSNPNLGAAVAYCTTKTQAYATDDASLRLGIDGCMKNDYIAKSILDGSIDPNANK